MIGLSKIFEKLTWFLVLDSVPFYEHYCEKQKEPGAVY